MRKSAKKLIAGFLAALMVLTMLPFTAFAREYYVGEVIDEADYVGQISPKLDIVWTAYTGNGKAFINNGDPAWQEAANNSGTPMDLSQVSVEGLTADQLPSNAQGAGGVGYVCATFILKDTGTQYGNIEIKFGWDESALTCGTRGRSGFTEKVGELAPTLETSKYDFNTDAPMFVDDGSSYMNDDNMIDEEGVEHTNAIYLAKGLPLESYYAIYVGDNFTFEKQGPNNGDQYSGVTIDGVYLCTIGFQIEPGVKISDHLIKFCDIPDLNRYYAQVGREAVSYAIPEGDYRSGVTPAGRLEVIYSEDQEPAEKEYTVTYKDANGSEISTEKVKEGNVPAQVPELPANDYDTENHYTYSWNGDTTAPITGDTTFQVVKSGTPHSYTSEVIQDATYDQPEITRYTCDCGYSYDKQTAPPLSHEHNYGTPVADYESDQAFVEEKAYTHTATCTAEGECNAPTKTDSCTFNDGEVIQNADYGKPEITKYTCTVCGGTYTKETAPALSHEHKYGEPVADYTSDLAYNEETAYTHTATCTAEGECDAKTVTNDCTFDAGQVIQEATVDQPEITKYTCSVCGGTYTKETASALKGYDVTVKGSDMGTVTLNDVAVDGDSLTKKIAANGTVKLVATASDTCEFVGWQVGNKIVSTDATYETIVNAPITYTPVFVDKSEALEFVFLDMFGNVISSQSVSNASEVVIPDAPVYNGYKFTGWTADADTIHQSQESMTITALFEKDTDANFTVNAEGATISYGDVSAENTLADVPYGTQVTVTKEGATGWQINGADVAYGDSYTFYVASDVTVAPIDTAVTAKPVVAAVSYSQLSNSHKVEFVASRAMTDDCTLIKAGWVYGKNLTDADLTLDKVGQVGTGTDSGVVKAAYVSSTEGSTQFILSYGITAQTGTASAKAFITYRDAEGEIQTVYSDAMNYTYGA